MPTLIEEIGKGFGEGIIGKILGPAGAAVKVPFDAGVSIGALGRKDIKPEKLTPDQLNNIDKLLKLLASISETTGSFVQSPIFLSILSVLTAPLIIGPIASALNEKTILRPIRDAVRPETLQALDVIGAWRRGSITPEDRAIRLNELGFPFEDQEALIRLSEAIPGPQDIIRFAVREVYDPVQRAALDLDAEIEPVLKGAADDIRTAGLPEDTFRKFWAAHWVLPSVGQSFEMRHRGVIDDVGLNSILKALDIAAVWRDRLQAIAFTPFTRVDIRRMHKLGVLDDSAVLRAYKDIGYDDEKAQLQVDFVKALNTNPTREDETFSDREAIRARHLTKADVVNAFEDGIIERKDVEQALKGLGYAPGEIKHIVDLALFKESVARSRKTVRNLQSGFVKGALDAAFVISFMGRMGLPASFIDMQLDAWRLEIESNVSLPTKAEILRWFAKDVLSESAAADALKRMGFASKWIDIMLKERVPITEVEDE